MAAVMTRRLALARDEKGAQTGRQASHAEHHGIFRKRFEWPSPSRLYDLQEYATPRIPPRTPRSSVRHRKSTLPKLQRRWQATPGQ